MVSGANVSFSIPVRAGGAEGRVVDQSFLISRRKNGEYWMSVDYGPTIEAENKQAVVDILFFAYGVDPKWIISRLAEQILL